MHLLESLQANQISVPSSNFTNEIINLSLIFTILKDMWCDIEELINRIKKRFLGENKIPIMAMTLDY